MSAKRSSRIRLEHRLPNGPALFLGRERELDWLSGALGRGPVVVLTGPGGIGKTALALRLVHERFESQVGRTLYFGIRPGQPTAQLRFDLVRILRQSTHTELDLGEIADDPEALIEAAIDIAEEHALWVVLDDAHHADATEMGELLTRLASYARQSRWLVTSLVEPTTRALAGQILALRGLPMAELISLANELSRGHEHVDVHRAVAAAAGSPWFLQQYIAAGETGVQLSRERLLENLGDRAEAFLQTLGLLQVPFPEDVLRQLTDVPDATILCALERRALLHRDPSGLRLHDVVSGWLSTPGPSEQERVAGVLASIGGPAALVEATRLYRNAGALDALVALLDAHVDAIFAEAQAPRLWAVIGELRDPRVVRHQLRCAAEMGNPTALGAVQQPYSTGPRERLAWAATLYAQGEVAQAQALVGPLETAAGGAVAVEATLLRARCLLHEAKPERAIAALAELEPEDPALVLRRDALSARAHVMVRHPKAETAIAELRRRTEATEGEALHDLAVALYEFGRPESAEELLEQLASTPRGGSASLLVARSALLFRARIRLERGDLVDAVALLDAVRPYVRSASLLRPRVFELDATRKLAVGDLDELAPLLETAASEARSIDRRLELRIDTLRDRFALLRGERPPKGSSPLYDIAGAPEAEASSLVKQRRSRRHGIPTSRALAPSSVAGKVEAHLLAADEALIGGHLRLAVEAAGAAVQTAARAGLRLLELDASLVLADAVLVAGPRAAHEAAIQDLVDRNRGIGSARVRLAVELHQRFDEPSVLERIACLFHVAPTSARRARALLGGAPPLDAVDTLVIDAVRALEPSLVVRTMLGETGPHWRSGWGLDLRRRQVWLGDGRVVDLKNKALPWKLLLAFVNERGDPVSKEALVLGVWEERSYHPARHDPRVRMSVRKLREILEDDASTPAKLLTAETGYRLGGVVRVAGALTETN